MSDDYCYSRTSRIVRGRLISIVRRPTSEEAEMVCEKLLDQGLDVLEIALTTPGALRAVEHLATRHPDALIGAGTVLDAPSARAAILVGARFLVSPSLSHEVLAMGHRYGAPTICGALTATEIESALSAGADLIKLFPAAQVGAEYLKAVRAALPQVPIVPTGGVNAENARSWLDAGAVALGVGHALTSDPEQLARLCVTLSETSAPE